jgi:hypothetical protein
VTNQRQGNLDDKAKRRRYRDTHHMALMLRRMIAAQGRRVAAGDVEDLAELLALRVHLDSTITEAIGRLRREQDFSWSTIALAAGTTKQAVQQRWGTYSAERSNS